MEAICYKNKSFRSMDLEMPFAIKVKGRDSQTAAETMQPLPTKHMIQIKMKYLFKNHTILVHF